VIEEERGAVVIREAIGADVPALTELIAQWGYPAQPAVVAARLQRVTGETDAVLVAVAASGVVGWVHVGLYSTLATDNAAQVLGLVVDTSKRRQSIGRQLMESAEAWARERGCHALYLRTRLSRRGAHAFYKRLGYRQIKTSLTFVREL